MEIDAVYSRLYNVAMFTESKIQVKKKKCPASLFFPLESPRWRRFPMLWRRRLRKICFIRFVRSASAITPETSRAES